MIADVSQSLIQRNVLVQVEILNALVAMMVASPTVSHVLVRGSLATGTADHLSDIDLLIGVDDEAFQDFLSVIDDLIRSEFPTLFGGWHDTLVGDYGGRGFVYLAPWKGELYQVDVYVARQGAVNELLEKGKTQTVKKGKGALVLFDRSGQFQDKDRLVPCYASADDVRRDETEMSTDDRVVEALVVFFMLRKRVLRGDDFMIYELSGMLHAVLRSVVKSKFSSSSLEWGWRNLDTELQPFADGRICCDALRALVMFGPVRTGDDVKKIFQQMMIIISHAAPDSLERLRRPIDAYRNYLNLPVGWCRARSALTDSKALSPNTPQLALV